MKKLPKILLFATAMGLAGAAAAQALKPEDKVKFRQAAYTFMAWNMEKIKAQTVDGSAPFDQAQVAAAANAIAAAANSGMGALYSPDTVGVVGFHKSRLKKEFFEQPDQVREIAINFTEQANKLAEIAAMGDKAEIAQQFGEVGKACKACHDKFRMKD
ncbi:c-type cytochrome [Tepidiphilus baoligensis]|uniref:Cytochrome c n=1 Tax=Tepidiphilus baoligensis TaxID=2698687 RepID=A0ABX1QMR0_9PROT|nr:cytochrome c [Tepidiphilus baoligensis]NMH16509.1 cytochrome c [Tepidiphilus baoligensis]